MILALLLCLLSELQAYSRNQRAVNQPVREEWPASSDEVLDQLTRDMFGYRDYEDFRTNSPAVHNPANKVEENMMNILHATKDFPGLYEPSDRVLISFLINRNEGIPGKATLKKELSDVWFRLSPNLQKQWKEKFPYAIHIEKLANMRQKPL
ncbi:hypothetical protein GCK32_008073 [Trichostrongylus colubriformis]|uniref:Uncharacterized protein n=1 Tax=Trichostrongylus colubriformis TaxID=6319 RepID=A0AAN8ISF9_TRICO